MLMNALDAPKSALASNVSKLSSTLKGSSTVMPGVSKAACTALMEKELTSDLRHLFSNGVA